MWKAVSKLYVFCTALISCFADVLGVSVDVVKSSYEAYQSWMNNHKKEEIDQ